MSNAVGPVCHIPPANQVGNPQARDIPGIPGPVSVSSSQSDITNLLNAMRQALLALLNQLNRNNNTTNKGGTISSPKPPQKPAQWTEVNRVTSTVRVFQNNDKNSPNWVDVEQINVLTMQDKSGNKWVWNRSNGGVG